MLRESQKTVNRNIKPEVNSYRTVEIDYNFRYSIFAQLIKRQVF